MLPFDRFAGADSLLGPEMRSTGEVMGIARDFPTAFAKAQAAAGARLPSAGTVFITVADGDKPAATGIATVLHDLGFKIIATRGTAQAIRKMGIPAEPINKIGEGSPHVVDWIERGDGRPRHQHAGRHRRARPTATRSAPRRSRAGSRASRRWPAGWRRRGRSRPRAAASREVISLQELHGKAGQLRSRERPRSASRLRSAPGSRPSPRARSTAPTSSSRAPTRTVRGRRPASSTC